jgi:hypothetical protein
VNHDLSINTVRGGRRYSTLLLRPRGKSLWYWVDEMWSSGQWKVEGQAFVDWVVERVIVIQEI